MSLNLTPRETAPATSGIVPAPNQYLVSVEPANPIIYRLTPREIENLDFSRFLFLFRVDRRELEGLEKLRGSVCVVLPNLSSGGGEPFVCATTRRFCRALFEAFPYWAYFFSLQDMGLWKMTLALVENSVVFECGEQWKTKIFVSDEEIAPLISQQIEHATRLARAASLPNLHELENEIRKYFATLIATYRGR